MGGLRTGAVAVVLVLVLGLVPGVAQAQPRQILIDTRLVIYSSTLTGTIGGSQFARASTTMFGLELNKYNPRTGLGFGAEFITGGLTSGEGNWLDLREGRTKFFGAWLSYNLLHATPSPLQLNVLAGYGKNLWEVTNSLGSRELFRAQGLMLGASTYVPLGRGLELWGRVAYIPWAGTSLENLVANTATGSAWDVQANLVYEWNHLGVAVGYRWKKDLAGNLSGCPDCKFKWTGPIFRIQYSW